MLTIPAIIAISVAGVVAYSMLLCFRAWIPIGKNKLSISLPPETGECPRFLLVIPVLREQAVIRAAILHFAEIRYDNDALRVTFVTSERETVEPHPEHSMATSEVIDRELEDWRSSGGRDIFRRIHYPYVTGFMADQINYSVRYIFEAYDVQTDIENTFVGVFNVDSRPGLGVLEEVAQRYRDTGACVFQQLSRYTPAQRDTPNRVSYAFACSFSVWQTRWSYLVERCRYLTSNRLNRLAHPWEREPFALNTRTLWRMPFSYTVGHGLFVRLKELIYLNYFPTRHPNEDAEFGFFLPFFGLAPLPLETPDVAETSNSVSTIIRQQASWIVGPMLSILYFKKSLKLFQLSHTQRFCAFIYSFRCLLDAVFWILGPLLLSISAIWCLSVWLQPASLSWQTAWFTASCWLIFFVVPTVVLHLSPLKPFNEISVCQLILGLSCLPICYVLHGLGGLLGVARFSYAFVTNSQYKKGKTER